MDRGFKFDLAGRPRVQYNVERHDIAKSIFCGDCISSLDLEAMSDDELKKRGVELGRKAYLLADVFLNVTAAETNQARGASLNSGKAVPVAQKAAKPPK